MARIYVPPWRIDVSSRSGVQSPVSNASLARLIALALTTAGAPSPASLALILSDDSELAELNVEHMGHEGPTDVLSFPMLPPSAFPPHSGQDPDLRRQPDRDFALPPNGRAHMGDIVVSVERAAAQAPEQGWSAVDELRQLVVHGVLHICGWDHAAPSERAAMQALEKQILASA